MVRLLLAFPGIDESHIDIWGLTSILESQRRQYHEINMFFANREMADSSLSEDDDDDDDFDISPHVCYICLKKGDDSKDRYFQCRNLTFCEFCPPLEMDERLCPACGECLTEGKPRQDSSDEYEESQS
jgi:hypothetical protein